MYALDLHGGAAVLFFLGVAFLALWALGIDHEEPDAKADRESIETWDRAREELGR